MKMVSEEGVKVSIAFTLFLLASFFVFTSYFVLFDSSLGLMHNNSPGSTETAHDMFSGFVVSLQNKGTRDSMVLSLTLVLAVCVFSLVYYWHYKSKTLQEDFY